MSASSGRLTGGCLFNAIRYECTEPPCDVHYCHCRLCQRAFGNVFAQVLLPNYPWLVNRFGFTLLIIGGIVFAACIVLMVGDRWRILIGPVIALIVFIFAEFRGG